MKRDLLVIVMTVLVTGILVRECAPRTEIVPSVPRIITQYDTVSTVPEWLADSIKRWTGGGRTRVIHTTDTVNVFISNTIIDTQFIPVNAPSEERPDLWPVLGYTSGGSFGDTAFVRTYSIRSGALAVSRVFTAGILTAIELDSGSSKPKMSYKAFPVERRGASLWEKIKYTTLGAAGTSVVCLLRP